MSKSKYHDCAKIIFRITNLTNDEFIVKESISSSKNFISFKITNSDLTPSEFLFIVKSELKSLKKT